jgi:hypothetical protein
MGSNVNWNLNVNCGKSPEQNCYQYIELYVIIRIYPIKSKQSERIENPRGTGSIPVSGTIFLERLSSLCAAGPYRRNLKIHLKLITLLW